ncbi:hypothetical protein [Paracoccus aerodenitrificans]|uniref:hypothetical protein n=1 Tax=Paracoccus aerodenitrificans TaxID=3017781 RepID=UPI0022F00449|nr:hypothetical protein [Paracoccus aerodenitrificans]WBU64414.1 hypothetical protein PAE61_02920 [Paracoccus aerodenitrificans]
MFTIEHEFDATIITLIDEPENAPLQGDVTITAFDDRVVLRQDEPETDRYSEITLSARQVDELRAALNLPEGGYRLDRR